MKVIPFTEHTMKSWDRFVEAHPCGTIYHDSAWIEILRDVFGYKQKGFILAEGEAIVGGLILYEVNGFMGKRLVSNPFRDRGGVLIKEKADPRPIFDKAAELLRKENRSYLLIKEENPMTAELIEQWDFKESNIWVTTRVDLNAGIDSLWKEIGDNASGPVKQAKRYGVKVCCGDSLVNMNAFYDIFIRSRKMLGVPAFPRSFFIALWNKLCLTGKAKLFLAMKNDIPIAGIILLLYKETVLDGYAASLPPYKHLRASDLLVWESLEWATKAGYRLFDFGADSSRQERLLAFKRKWHGTHKTMHHYYLFNGKGKIDSMDSSEGKYLMPRKLLRSLPLPLFSWVSDRIVAHFG